MYDIIIIGGGPAGISASLYTVRANLKTLVIYKEKSALEKVEKIENYYGFENGINGQCLYKNGIKQAENLGVQTIQEEVINIQIEMQKDDYIFKVQTLNKQFYGRKVILATGNKKSKPNIENIDKYEGKGISYCAICDAFFYKNKDVVVIGNGDYAIAETINLKDIVKSVTILTNGQPSPECQLKNVYILENEIKEIQRSK